MLYAPIPEPMFVLQLERAPAAPSTRSFLLPSPLRGEGVPKGRKAGTSAASFQPAAVLAGKPAHWSRTFGSGLAADGLQN